MISTASATPLALFRLPPQTARVCNALLALAGPWTLPAGLGRVWPEPLGGAFPSVCRLSLRCGEVLWQVALSNHVWLRAHPVWAQVLEAAQDETLSEALPLALQEALLESLAHLLCRSLETILNRPVGVEDVRLQAAAAQSEENAPGFTLRLELARSPEEPLFARCTASDPQALSQLTDCLAAWQARQDAALSAQESPPQNAWIEQLPLPVRFEAGNLQLSVRELTALVPGDILLPDDYPAARQRLYLRVGRSTLWRLPCSLSGAHVVVESLSPTPNPLESAMPDALLTAVPESRTVDPDALEVPLLFELEEQCVTVGELRRVAPGHTFTLGKDPLAPVTLRVHGKALGTGRLVDLNGTLGVQVLTLGLTTPPQACPAEADKAETAAVRESPR